MQLFETFAGMHWFEQLMILTVVLAAFASLVYAWWLRRDVLSLPKGTEQMQSVWNGIREGALSYLGRQLKTILPILIVLSGALFFTVYVTIPEDGTLALWGITREQIVAQEPAALAVLQQIQIVVGIGRSLAFVLGASFSLIVGQLGMRIAVESNIRVAQATREGENRYNRALTISYRGGTFTGMLTDGLGLLGGTAIFIIYGIAAPDALLGFGLGGTLLALFMRVGGGIYTKAADVGADLVGKVEHGLPEDDPRNAAVVADLVGDNVGDCAGMAADIFESYEVTIVSSLILAIVLYLDPAYNASLLPGGAFALVVFPLFVRAVGVISSMIGTFMVPVWPKLLRKRAVYAEKAMFLSYEASSAFTITLTMLLSWFYVGDLRFGILVAVGVMLAVSFNPITSYFTSLKKPPVQEIVKSADTGTATFILSGLVAGYESTVAALVVIVTTFGIAAALFLHPIAVALSPFFVADISGAVWTLYGIALIGIGMLSHTGNNVAMDSYGPISDNAAGIGELSPGDFDHESQRTMHELDAVGNTTKAITKGVAIASAVIAAVSLFNSYAAYTGLLETGIRIDDPLVFSGVLLGAALPWLFSALNMKAVTRAAGEMVKEVRRQFKIPGILEGTVKPDYDRAVGISTTAAQKELISLAAITVSIPIMVGILFQEAALGGFLGGIIISGQLLAVFMSNAGGAWDNAKKSIEDEPCDVAHNTGKGSERHKCGVVGDTVGDPLKDTAGPALNPMIKVVNLLSLILAPMLTVYKFGADMTINLALLAALAVMTMITIWAIRKSTKPADFGMESAKVEAVQ
ncbi:MAG: sodium-translocating pyrophosphatase [Candidatus Thorarchaeota archaeon SMTZ1-45]|nr:MAG: sodium-translocating pyrophosphatase [Candidatus Thorarchaeota archaeon SMTZ1-45]